VEEYRRQVDQRRAEETPDEPGRPAHVARPRRPWTPEEEARYAELHAAAVAASVARRDAMVAAGIVSTYDAEAAMRAAARDTGEA
jgi:hypothetical protein